MKGQDQRLLSDWPQGRDVPRERWRGRKGKPKNSVLRQLICFVNMTFHFASIYTSILLLLPHYQLKILRPPIELNFQLKHLMPGNAKVFFCSHQDCHSSALLDDSRKQWTSSKYSSAQPRRSGTQMTGIFSTCFNVPIIITAHDFNHSRLRNRWSIGYVLIIADTDNRTRETMGCATLL